MGGIFSGPKMPDMAAAQRDAEARAEAKRKKEEQEASQKAWAETTAKAQASAGRAATLLTSEREKLNKAGLLG